MFFLHRQHDFIHRKSSRNLKRKLKLERELGKVIKHKVISSLKISFTTSSEYMNYIGINLEKCVLEHYNENYRILLREIRKLNEWSDILYSCNRRQYILS